MIKTKRLKKWDRPQQVGNKTKDLPVFYLNKQTPNVFLDTFIDGVLYWCKDNLGKKRRSLPQIDWDWDDYYLRQNKANAEYLHIDNIISLRIKGHRTIYNLANTIIHEYVHYLQPHKGTWYSRYEKKFGYSKNPYEIEAYRIAGIWEVKATHDVIRSIFPMSMRGIE